MGGVVHMQKQSIRYLSSGPNDFNNHSYFLSTILSTALSLFPSPRNCIFSPLSLACVALSLCRPEYVQ